MDLNALRTRLSAALDAGVAVPMNDTTLGTTGLDVALGALAASPLGDSPRFSPRGPLPEPNPLGWTVPVTVSLRRLGSLDGDLVFHVAEGGASGITLRVPLRGLSLGDVFAEAEGSGVGGAALGDAALVYTWEEGPGAENGLWLEAELTEVGLIQGAALLFQHEPPSKASARGRVQYDSGRLTLVLRAPVNLEVELGPIQLAGGFVGLSLTPALAEPEGGGPGAGESAAGDAAGEPAGTDAAPAPVYEGAYLLGGEVVVAGRGFEIVGSLTSSGYLRLGLEADHDLGSLEDLAALLGDATELLQQVPNELAGLRGLSLRSVAVTLYLPAATLAQRVANIEVRVGIAEGWTLFDHGLVLTNLQVTFVLLMPGLPSGRFWYLGATAQVMLGRDAGWVFALDVAIPGLQVSGELRSQGPGAKTLGELLRDIGAPAPPDELDAVGLVFVGIRIDVPAKRFTVDAELGASVSLGDELNLELKPVVISATGGAGGWALDLAATLEIAGQTLSMTADLGRGLELNGHWEAGYQCEIGLVELVDVALAPFKVALPDGFPDADMHTLDVRWSRATGVLGFEGVGTVRAGELTAGLLLTIQTPATDRKTGLEFRGVLQAGPAQFEIDLSRPSAPAAATGGSAVADVVTAFELRLDRDNATLRGLIDAIGYDGSVLPVDVELRRATVALVPALSALRADVILGIAGVDTTWSFLTLLPSPPSDPPQRTFVGAARLTSELSLRGLPLLGRLLPGSGALALEQLTFYAVSLDLTALQVARIQGCVVGEGTLLPAALAPGPTGLPRGAGVNGALRVGGKSWPLQLPLGSPAAAAPSAPPPGAAPAPVLASRSAPAGDKTKWIPVGKTVGGLSVARFGLRMEGGETWLALDASVRVGGLAVSTVGLGLGFPLKDFELDRVRGQLDGLGVDFAAGKMEIGGAFAKVRPSADRPDVTLQYDGAIVLRYEDYALNGLGSFAEIAAREPGQDPSLSMFLFAELDVNIGGPPYFRVRGILAGFGFNSRLRLPAQDQVDTFPFVGGVRDPSVPLAKPPTPMQVMQIVGGRAGVGKRPPVAWVSPSAGDYWAAAGIRFTTFEVLETRALLAAVFGTRLEFALIGLSRLVLPRVQDGAPPVVDAELGLLVHVAPADGVVLATARLSASSWVLDPQCHLTGGFALGVWYADAPVSGGAPGARAGDFVVTLGGYHPRFAKPSWYPEEPRLGISWRRGDYVTIKGGAYFALTPAVAMAGGSLEVVFAKGDLRAWFRAWLDCMLRWKPLHYEAEIGVRVGASYTVRFITSWTVRVEVGAKARIWGPPFGGEATIDLDVCSVTVRLGDSRRVGPVSYPDWAAFAAAALPAKPDVLAARVGRGLVGTGPGDLWLMDCEALELELGSAVPATSVTLGGVDAPPERPAARLSVRPIGANGVPVVASELRVVVRSHGGTVDQSGRFAAMPRQNGVPRALWAPTGASESGREAVLPDAITGIRLSARPVDLAAMNPRPPVDLDDTDVHFAMLTNWVPTAGAGEAGAYPTSPEQLPELARSLAAAGFDLDPSLLPAA